MPQAGERGEHELPFLDGDAGLLEHVARGPTAHPSVEGLSVLLSDEHDELGRVSEGV